ncbi:MAG TPA: DNA-processing protein DprA [Solirubrobacteraceae bacterium]|jgi:DNA processing protein|nr:DNA-processing protein DprA [Solirubrobacteraceae bacterium]
MSSPELAGACQACLRRSWLLAELGGVLDCNCRADGRLLDLLELSDGELIDALAGRRRVELTAAYASFRRDLVACAKGIAQLCRHDDVYPSRLRDCGVSSMLHVAGGATPGARLGSLCMRPVVAFVGHGAASDYGVAVASSLARQLAASGVTVAAAPPGAIGLAALAAAIEVGAGAITIVGGGLDVGTPARRRSLLRQVMRAGCAVSELPPGAPRRRWSVVGCERVLASLASVALVVETDERASGLFGAQVARRHGRTVAAVPGRVSSRGSRGAHALLRDGAALVTCAGDVLELIYEAEGRRATAQATSKRHTELEPRLRHVLEQVGDGCDTPGKLLAKCSGTGEPMRSLGELELLGLLERGDGGRYVLADPLAPPASRYGVR